jgi:hypothetical protein
MRFRPIGLLLSGVVVASSACSTDATAPSPMAVAERAASAKGREPGVALILSTDDRFADVTRTTYTVTIDPNRRNLLHFGPHSLDIPARAICSADSDYGIESFDRECALSSKPVTITAVVRATTTGIPRIDFSPELRFSPRRAVVLNLYVPDVSPRAITGRIIYCPTDTMIGCVDEAAIDHSLETHIDYRASTLFRRIKHFSGYFVET